MPLAPHIPQCHHVRINGTRCGSPAMRNRNHCFYHLRSSTRLPVRSTDLPLLEDGNSIQLGIAQVIRRVLAGESDLKASLVLLHAYRLALLNLKNLNVEPYHERVVTVHPAFDPENAGPASEPCTRSQFAQIERELAVARQHSQTGSASVQVEAVVMHTAPPASLDPSPPDYDTDDELETLLTALCGNRPQGPPDAVAQPRPAGVPRKPTLSTG